MSAFDPKRTSAFPFRSAGLNATFGLIKVAGSQFAQRQQHVMADAGGERRFTVALRNLYIGAPETSQAATVAPSEQRSDYESLPRPEPKRDGSTDDLADMPFCTANVCF